MKVILSIILIISLYVTSDTKESVYIGQNEKSILVDDLNQSIIDGFFDGDTIGKDISGVHFVK